MSSKSTQPSKLSARNHAIWTVRVWGLLSVIAIALGGCSQVLNSDLPTPIPSKQLPTMIALTSQAGSKAKDTQLSHNTTSTPKATETPPASPTSKPSTTPTYTQIPSTSTPTSKTQTPASVPTSDIPKDEIQIRRPGALSKVSSPLHINAYMRTGAEGRIQIELLGEDNRVLARQVKVISYVPPKKLATIRADLDFEIAATAELGRLKISTNDEYGRTMALNSIPLVLLSLGNSDILTPNNVLAPIVIQAPSQKALIEGDTLFVSGIANPESNQPLMVRLINQDGEQVGMRLAGVSIPPDGGYGTFSVEVPYEVNEATEVRLIVSEGGANITDVIHLSSLEVVVSP